MVGRPDLQRGREPRRVVARIRRAAPDVDVLVVDDGSPDGTGELADPARRRRPAACRCCTAARKEGLGAAYVDGFRVALDAGYDVIGEMDADGSHQPEELPRLLAALCATPTW